MGQIPITGEERRAIDTIARYQFRLPQSVAFLPVTEDIEVLHSRSGRIDRIYLADERMGTVTTNGRLTLGGAGGRRLHELCEPPHNRVAVTQEAVPYVGVGSNTFAKFVSEVDPGIRPRDEVVIVDVDDRPIAVGRAELSAAGMRSFERGMAVSVRSGLLDTEPA